MISFPSRTFTQNLTDQFWEYAVETRSAQILLNYRDCFMVVKKEIHDNNSYLWITPGVEDIAGRQNPSRFNITEHMYGSSK